MRLIVRSTCVIALASFATLLVSTGAVRAESLAIVNARAYTGEQAEPIERATIVIDDGRIVSVDG